MRSWRKTACWRWWTHCNRPACRQHQSTCNRPCSWRRELAAELERADAAGDAERSKRAQEEHDALVAALTSAHGLGGRPRRSGGTDERARQAVSWRVRDALGRIERVHPELAAHLRLAVRTGAFCAYEPAEPTGWSL